MTDLTHLHESEFCVLAQCVWLLYQDQNEYMCKSVIQWLSGVHLQKLLRKFIWKWVRANEPTSVSVSDRRLCPFQLTNIMLSISVEDEWLEVGLISE